MSVCSLYDDSTPLCYLLQRLLLVGREWRQAQFGGGGVGGRLSVLHDESRPSLLTPPMGEQQKQTHSKLLQLTVQFHRSDLVKDCGSEHRTSVQ